MDNSPSAVQHDFPLARLTTVRTGGSAKYFARVSAAAVLEELLAWADRNQIELSVVGSGSNLLIADSGFCGLVIKLERELTQIQRQGSDLICGGGARLPSVAAFAARNGLSGIEFGVNIPGTVGGAVKMNANAYNGVLGDALRWVDVATSNGTDRKAPEDFDFRYRCSNLRSHEVVLRACFQLDEAPVDQVKGALAQMRAKRQAAQPSGIKTFGSTFKNPDSPPEDGPKTAGQLLSAVGCNGLQVGGARFSEKHANFVENVDQASTDDIVRLMASGRQRVRERFGIELEPEVQTLGDIVWPWNNS